MDKFSCCDGCEYTDYGRSDGPDCIHIDLCRYAYESRDTEIKRLRRLLEAAVADMECVDKCDVCRNSMSNDKHYDEGEQEYFPRRFKCDSCFLGGGEQNNFEWRGLQDEEADEGEYRA